jgi:Putative Actinobacterial Holin-X, holin superfamily III
MDRQETLNGAAHPAPSTRALGQKFASLAHDVILIAELQAQLFAADVRAWRRASGLRVGLAIGGIVLLAAAVPTALMGAGICMAEWAGVSPGVGLLCAASLAALGAGGLLLLASRRGGAPRKAFERSTRELSANVAAIRRLLSDVTQRSTSP